ncbi:hypothetical protein COHA_010236 [Chlorella ohadii]|uniref:SBP-type domain-containing protein n=1 Tax=Chlorella ohadii TaxID=2649997 RepID=A0AAD5DD88_9CHLO|nr:hypothetical protein COHA_010236 [Chlorella ohadii]
MDGQAVEVAEQAMEPATVPGCGVDLVGLAQFYRRVRICEEHGKAHSITDAQGRVMRFCQQCSKLQPLELFMGDRRSCAASLDKRRARRNVAAASVRASGEASPGCGDGEWQAVHRKSHIKRRSSASQGSPEAEETPGQLGASKRHSPLRDSGSLGWSTDSLAGELPLAQPQLAASSRGGSSLGSPGLSLQGWPVSSGASEGAANAPQQLVPDQPIAAHAAQQLAQQPSDSNDPLSWGNLEGLVLDDELLEALDVADASDLMHAFSAVSELDRQQLDNPASLGVSAHMSAAQLEADAAAAALCLDRHLNGSHLADLAALGLSPLLPGSPVAAAGGGSAAGLAAVGGSATTSPAIHQHSLPQAEPGNAAHVQQQVQQIEQWQHARFHDLQHQVWDMPQLCPDRRASSGNLHVVVENVDRRHI